MTQDTEITNVSFHIATYEPNESDEQPIKEVLAVFVDENYFISDDNNYNRFSKQEPKKMFKCYANLGKHSTCSKSFLAQKTKKATKTQYKELLNELIQIGYNLKIV